VAEAELLELLPGLSIAVARTGHLVVLKLLARHDSRRPQDRADLTALLRVATPEELVRARQAIALVTTRGYDRGRDLAGDLDRLLAARLRE
jgi:hypothetical protein